MQISGVQTDVVFGEPEENLQRMQSAVQEEVAAGSQMVVFPECFTAGYCFDSLEEALPFGETMNGPAVSFAADLCATHKCFVVFGMLEKDGARLFNTAVLVGPEGLIGSYRKVHLPYLGIDRFTTPGDRPFEVFDAGGVRFGMLICYDGGFPEASRVLALKGADVILLPTNWPTGAEYMSSYSVNSRSMENGVYFAAVNRIGVERGFKFIGRSRTCGPVGATIDSADHTQEAVVRMTVDTITSREKRIVRVPGKHIIDRFADRRPEMYSEVCQPHNLPRPGRDEPV